MPPDRTDSFTIGSWVIDGRAKEVRNRGQLLKLSGIEFSVLHQLVDQANNVVLREEFAPWNKKALSGERHPVDNIIVKLKRCLAPDFTIEGVRGCGYRLTTAIPFKRVVSPMVSVSRTLGAIAADRMKMHSGHALPVSVRHYEEILKGGPDAVAYVDLVKALINLGHTGFCKMLPHETVPRARKRLAEALAHFPRLASAYALRGLTNLIYDYDWQRAYEDLNHALQLDADTAFAHCFLAHMDVAQGRREVGLTHARRGADLDPTTPMTVFAVPMLLYFAGRPDEAAAEAVHNLELFEPFPIGAILHGYALEAVGATKRAIREYNRALGMGFFPDAVARLGHAYGTMGDRPKALSYLQELHDAEEDGKIAYVSGYLEALIHVGLGDHHQALTCLENSLAQRCDWLIYLNVEPCWRDLRKYDQFQMLARKVGLTITGAL